MPNSRAYRQHDQSSPPVRYSWDRCEGAVAAHHNSSERVPTALAHQGQSWIIRVDIAMSDLSSAIHNTGHYHVRPRPVCLAPSCARSANNGPNRRSSCVLASLDLATRNATRGHQRRGISTATNLRGTCSRGAWSGFSSDRSLAKHRAGTARSRPPTERWQDKRREVRGGRAAE